MLTGHWSSNDPLSDHVVTHLCTSVRHHLAGYNLCHELIVKKRYDFGSDGFVQLFEVFLHLGPLGDMKELASP